MPRKSADQAPHHRLYAQHCGRTFEEVERTLDRDRFMTAEEALEWGLIDRILQQREETRGLEAEA